MSTAATNNQPASYNRYSDKDLESNTITKTPDYALVNIIRGLFYPPERTSKTFSGAPSWPVWASNSRRCSRIQRTVGLILARDTEDHMSNSNLPLQGALPPKDSGPTGVGGWLLFFLLTVLIFRPLMFAGVIIYAGLSGKAAYTFGYNFLPICLQILMMLAAIDMWRHKEARSVRLMLVYLWILLGFSVLVFLSAPTNGSVLFYPIIWLMYLKSSRRVKNTYHYSPKESSPAEIIGYK